MKIGYRLGEEMKIYVARHGQTLWNVQNRVCGRTDVVLTQEGINQAKRLAQEVKKYKIDFIIASPLTRAQQTSQIVAEENGLEILTDERLIEQNYGIYEGVERTNQDFLANKRNFAYRYPGGESMMQVAYRTYSLIEEIKEKYSDKNVLLICHGGVSRVINTYFNDLSNDEFFHYELENAKLQEYEI